MDISVRQGSLTEVQCDALIINLFEGVKEPGGGTGAVDKALGGAVTKQIAEDEFEGKLGECMIVRPSGAFPARKVIVVGLGKREDFGSPEILKASASAGRKCRELKSAKVVSILHGAGIAGLQAFDCARAVALGTILGTYEFTRYMTENGKPNPIQEFEIVEHSADKIGDIQKGIDRGQVIGDAVAFARDMTNEPSNVVTPSYLAKVAETIAGDNRLTCKVMDRKQFEAAGMGLYAAVARGSSVEPKFIELRYEHPDAKKTIALIGKGITYDTGGYSLKTPDSMLGMKDDMSGAAAVLATMRALGAIRPKVNILALVAATENSIGPDAIHPGDIVKSLNGKTVEINNTDAEGRLTLGDAAAYAKKIGVDEIIDLATLTGACVTAVGKEIAGIMGTDQKLIENLITAGKSCGEAIWQLPLFMGYMEQLKSDVADLKNTEKGGAGATMGALFISAFVGDTPWAHMDLSSAMIDKDLSLAKKGAVGIGAGTLIEYLTSYL